MKIKKPKQCVFDYDNWFIILVVQGTGKQIKIVKTATLCPHSIDYAVNNLDSQMIQNIGSNVKRNLQHINSNWQNSNIWC